MLVAAASPILAPDAHAGEPPKIVISRSMNVGDATSSRVDPAWVDARLAERLDLRLGEHYAISRAERCDEKDPACSLARARRGHATYVVRSTLDAEQGDHRVRIEAIRPADGYTIVIAEDTCEICGAAEIEGFLDNVIGTFLARLDAIERAPVAKPTAVVIAPAPPRTPALRIAGYATLGAGGAAALAGGILWGLDGRPHRGSCEVPDTEGRCPNVYSSRAGGIALTAVGLAAIGAGAAMLIVDRVRRGRGDRRASAHLRVNGASLSWSF